MSTEILPADAPLDAALSSPADGLSLLSYNVLLPNSAENGWWIPKYYEPSVPPEQRAWPHRQALIRQGLLGAVADILCLQETTPECFEEDWAFLREAGYDHAVHRKGELRCATFWRRDRWSLADEPRHQDRVLLTALGSLTSSRSVQIANVHLKAGAEPGRRLRQVAEVLEQISKRSAAQGARLDEVPVVLCGDFNTDVSGSALEHLLSLGEVTPDFREATYPDTQLTSKTRKNPLGPFLDSHAQAFGAHAPPTLLLPDRERFFFSSPRIFSEPFLAAVRALFLLFSGGSAQMDRSAVDAWISAVNGRPERGSEWTKAAAIFASKGAEVLLQEDIERIYMDEVLEGKPWGVLHDLSVCGALPELPPHRVFARRFDQIHYTPRALQLQAVRRPLSEERLQAGATLPSAWHPSDHLPVGAVFRWGNG